MDWNLIGKIALAIVAAIAGAGIVIRFVNKSRSTTVIQKNIRSRGDVVGGNKTTNSNNRR